MPTIVIHCRYAAGYPADQYVYCGRPSKWGNPYSLVGDGGQEIIFNRADAIRAFRSWFYAPEQAQLRADALVELKDKVLGCWCHPKSCHVDIIADYVNLHAPTD